MTATPQRAEPLRVDEPETLELTNELAPVEQVFDSHVWAESRVEALGAGGRQVLGTTLSVLAALWLAYTAWSAGRSLSGMPLSSPQIAQWVAVAAGPLAAEMAAAAAMPVQAGGPPLPPRRAGAWRSR